MRCIANTFWIALTALLCRTALSVEPAPRLTCAAPRHNFGALSPAEMLTHTFTIRNEGNALLEVTRVRACCGGSATISTKRLPPGTEADVSVSVALRGLSGGIERTVHVESNDPLAPRYALKLVGKVTPDITIEPSVVNFGHVTSNTTSKQRILVTRTAGDPFRVTNVICQTQAYRVEWETVREGQAYAVDVFTVPPLPPGAIAAKLLIQTDHPRNPTLYVPVVATLPWDISIVPSRLPLPQPSETTATRAVLVRSISGTPFQILKVGVPDPRIRVDIATVNPHVYRVTLADIPANANLDGAHIEIHTDHPNARRVTVALYRTP